MGTSLLATLAESGSGSDVVISSLNEHLSVADIQALVDRLSKQIQNTGSKLLALHADNGPAWIIADLACQSLDICLLPLPTFFSHQQIRTVVGQCQLNSVLTDDPAALQGLLEEPVAVREAVSGLQLCEFSRVTGDAPRIPPGTGKITFTSGSSGDPKGVCLSNRQLLMQADALRSAVDLESPRHLCLLPLSTLLENVAGVYAPLLAGGQVIVPSLKDMGYEGSRLAAPERLLGIVNQTAPDTVILIPELLKLFVGAARSGWQPPESFKFIAVGGSKVGRALLQEARSLGLPVFEGYGLSECASVVSLNTDQHRLDGSCGKPLPHLELLSRDGEIVVKGNAMLGYVNRPESWFQDSIHTGDIGSLDEKGFLHLSGRRNNILISSYGRNISPEWPESELLANPLLQDAVVYGDARPCCVALISAKNPQTDDEVIQAWIDLVNSNLPDYARIKAWHRLETPLGAIPGMLTDNGRPRRNVIAMHFAGEIESMYASGKSPDDVKKMEKETSV